MYFEEKKLLLKTTGIFNILNMFLNNAFIIFVI